MGTLWLTGGILVVLWISSYFTGLEVDCWFYYCPEAYKYKYSPNSSVRLESGRGGVIFCGDWRRKWETCSHPAGWTAARMAGPRTCRLRPWIPGVRIPVWPSHWFTFCGESRDFKRDYRLNVPYWALTGAALAAPLLSTARRMRKRMRQNRGCCIACGYDLRATPGRCPECGTVPPPGDRPGGRSDDSATARRG